MKQHTPRRINAACARAVALILAASCAAAPFAAAQAPAPAPAAAASSSPATPPAAMAPAAPAAPPQPAPLTNEQASYFFGLNLAEQLRSFGVSKEDITDAVMRGMKDGIAGKRSTPAEMKAIQDYMKTKVTEAQAHNKTASEEFLARNGKEKGVTTTASGLEYKVLAAGDAKAPAIGPSDQVVVNYRGKLLDGTEFDSSYARGMPGTFPVGGVIKGWQEALQLMKPGGKYVVYVPPELAYGQNPHPSIPPNSLLIFDVEVVGVKGKAETAAPAQPTAGTAAPAGAPAH